MESCSTCKFWHRRGDEQLGTCRRFPPLTTPHGIYTNSGDWCGEWLSLEVRKEVEVTAKKVKQK